MVLNSRKEIIYKGSDYWKNYMVYWFGEELIEKWERYAEVKTIESVNGKISIEVYRNTDSTKPVIVFSHGIAGYARILLPFLIPLFEKGYHIIAPDLEGYGYNERVKGDFTWDMHLENLRDTVNYARSVFDGNVFLGGASMGGPMAYATDARYDCADGLICWCLWDFADPEFMLKETTTKHLTFFLVPFLKWAATWFGKIRLKTYRFVSYDTLTSSREFNEMLKNDPQAGTMISFRGASSLVTQSKADLEHERYIKPVLVCQPEQDRMTPASYSKKTFDEFKQPCKKYVSFEGAHFPTDFKTYLNWAGEVDSFINEWV